jgi:hypothetical protein
VAGIPIPQSFPQFLGQSIDAVTSRTGVRRLRVGGPILSILEASAQADVRSTQAVFQGLEANDLDNATGALLDKTGRSEDCPRFLTSKSTGTVDVGDGSFVKIASKVYQGTPAPIVGSVTLNVEKDSFNDAPSTGSVYIGRNTPNIEGPLAYTAKTDAGAYWTLTIASTTRFHNKGEEVVLAQGGNRVVDAGQLVATPQGALSSAVQFSVVYDATIPDGETELQGVEVIAVNPGASGRVPAGAISAFVGSDPFPGATVTNTKPFTSGRDTEKDDDYRERIREKRQTKQGATDLANETAVLGAISPDENKQVSSSKLVRRPGRPDYLYIDDGSGYEEISAGVGLEIITESAIGGERDFSAIYSPVTKAFVQSANEAPFALQDSAQLRARVGGVVTSHSFDTSEFNAITSASAYEAAASINADSTCLYAARTANSGKTLVLFSREDANEDIQVLTSDGIDASGAFGFPTSTRYTSLLYRNDRLLSKDGRDAVIRSNRFASWNSFAGTQTIQTSVDLTSVATYSFVDQDFIDAATGFTTVGKNSLVAWAAVINRKLPGVTCTVELDQLVLTSNLGPSANAKIDITGGTLVSNFVFSVGSESGLNADYVLDRGTGQFFLAEVAAAGDSFTLGSEWTRAFIETAVLAPTTLADDGTSYWAIDGATSIVQHGVGSATALTATVGAVTDAGFQVRIRAAATSPAFTNVLPGDWAVLFDPSTNLPSALRNAFRVIKTGLDGGSLRNDIFVEKRALNGARAAHGTVALTPVGLDPSRVLVCGGYLQDVGSDGEARHGRAVTATVEIFDPATGIWTLAASMATARYAHTATAITGNKVLVTGGFASDGAALATTEIYDVATDTWTAGPAMSVARARHSATLLTSGRVLVAGGTNGTAAQTSSQEFNPGTSTFLFPAAMITARYGHGAVLVPAGSAAESNNVIAAGGFGGAKLASVERYDTTAHTWAAKTSMNEARNFFGIAPASAAKLIVVGDGEAGAQIGTYALYDLAANTWATSALPSSFKFENKPLAKVATSGDVYALYGYKDDGVAPRQMRHYRWDSAGSSWNLLADSLFAASNIEKTSVGVVTLGGVVDTVFAVGGVSRLNVDATGTSAGIVLGHHEQIAGTTWSYPDASDALAALPLPARGLQIVRTTRALQRTVIPAGTNYTAVTFAEALATLEGATPEVFKTSRLRVSTNSFDEAGDLALVASDISGPSPLLPNLLPLPIGVQENLTGHFASVEAARGLGVPQGFRVHRVGVATAGHISDSLRTVFLTAYPDALDASARPSSGTTMVGLRRNDDGVNPTYISYTPGADGRLAEWGNLDHGRAAVSTFDVIPGVSGFADSYRVGLRRDFLQELAPQAPVILASGLAMGPDDTLSVVVDEDTETKRFVIPATRELSPATATYGTTVSLKDGLTGGTLSTTFGIDYDFNDFVLYMRARAKSHSATAAKRVLWRFNRFGAEGNYVKLRYLYPDAADASPELEVRLDQDDTIVGYSQVANANTDAAPKINVHVKLGSGAARTGGTLREDARLGFFRAYEPVVGSKVFDTYVVSGFSVVQGERTAAGGTTRLRIQVPNDGTVAHGPQDSGLVAGNVMWFEAAVPGATTLLSGAFQIQSVGAFNAGTGQQDIFVPANTLHDGTSTWALAANPGTVSADGTGEVVFDPSTAAGDLFRSNASNLTSFAGVTMRVVASGRQYLRCTAPDIFDDGIVEDWVSILSTDDYLHFQAPTQTATALVAAINALDGVVTGTVTGTGAGVISLATWDEVGNANSAYALSDGINYVQRTIAPALPSLQHQFLMRDPVAADLLTNNDWTNEEVRIGPVLTPDLVEWFLTPCISGLFTAAEVVASSDGQLLQIASLTPGSAGAVEVQGGTMNSATAAVSGAAREILRTNGFSNLNSAVTLPVAEADGFTGGTYVRIDNTYTAPKAKFWAPGTTVTVAADGLWSFNTAPFTVTADLEHARISIEKVGDFVAVHYPFSQNTSQWNPFDWEFQYLHVRGRGTATSDLADVANANQGVFRIVRGTLTEHGVTIWIENPGAIEESAEADLLVLTADSVVPGDEFVVSTTAFGARNKQTWRVTEVGATTLGGDQFVSNCFRVDLADGVPDVVSTSFDASSSVLVQVREGVAARLWKRLVTISPATTGYVDFQFDSSYGFESVGQALGSVITAADKLSFASGVFLGVDGYAHSTGLVGEANRIIYGDATDPATYPGTAASGAEILIAGPRIKRLRLSLALRVRSGQASPDLADRARSAVAAVVNPSPTGTSMPISDIITAAAAVGGIDAVSVLHPAFSSTSDVIPVAADEKLLALDLVADIAISFVGQ